MFGPSPPETKYEAMAKEIVGKAATTPRLSQAEKRRLQVEADLKRAKEKAAKAIAEKHEREQRKAWEEEQFAKQMGDDDSLVGVF